MLVRYKIPKTLLWVVNLFLIFFAIFTIFRFTTFFAFRPEGSFFLDLLPSFLLGILFDLRWISLILLPIVLISLRPHWSPFYSEKNKRWWTWYLAIITFIVFFFFAADLGSFAYNQTRLDAGALNFAEDFQISVAMIWQTYPLVWMLLGLLVAVLLFRWMYHKSHWRVISKTEGLGIPYRRKYFLVSLLVLALFVYGNLSTSPLKWSRAMGLGTSFQTYLSLNPLQNFFTTLRFRKPDVKEERARASFPILQEWMGPGWKDLTPLKYERRILPDSNVLESSPNIVLVLCESFSMYKSSMSGNPLNTTPYFNKMSKEGIFFDRCFTPHFSTARGLFATITGIPDVQQFRFSTRNPEALQQRTIINDFEGYDKLYFLGGDPGFNNFTGLLKNIEGLEIFSEGKFSSPRMNVWGISDKNLFLEANKEFSKRKNPFFAIIQTADNHRPFMIPEEDKDFQVLTPSTDSLKEFGFDSAEEYNSFRYSDYCFQIFMEDARKQPWFHNTIFVFVGDHGVAGNARAVYPGIWTSQRLTDEHVPMLYYAPYLLKPEQRSEVVSLVDVLPTIAGFLHQPYTNSTLGRDLLAGPRKNFAFITNSQGRIGVLTDHYYFTMNAPLSNQSVYKTDAQLYQVNEGTGITATEKNKIMESLSALTLAMYETSKWMIMHNEPR